jgi:ABC-type multidrug transport system ATPase subunit
MQRSAESRSKVRPTNKLTCRQLTPALFALSLRGVQYPMTQIRHALILKATSLHFSYPGQALFINFSARIAQGITLVRGGDGRGKTTLLRLLAGALPAQSGQLQIKNSDVQTQPADYKAHVFFTEPRSDVFDQLSVPDYFELQRTKYAGFDNNVLAAMTRGFGLQDHLHKQLFMLSTGSKRKVFLAAASASNAAVTLLDEPFAALDAASIRFASSWLQTEASNNSRIFVVADHVAPDGLALTHTIDLGD